MIVSVFRSNKDMMDSNNQLLASLLFVYLENCGWNLKKKRSVYCKRTKVAFAENPSFQLCDPLFKKDNGLGSH